MGCLCCGAQICCTFPLEYVKTVSQLSTGKGGATQVIRDTMRTSGPLGFYRGLSSMVYFATPKAAIRFSSFEVCAETQLRRDAAAQRRAREAAPSARVCAPDSGSRGGGAHSSGAAIAAAASATATPHASRRRARPADTGAQLRERLAPRSRRAVRCERRTTSRCSAR
eukprot:6260938-Prymnesium_polylepis.2